MRSGASGFFVLPGLILGEMGSLTAIFFAFAGGTPSIAAWRCAGESLCGGRSFFALLFFAAAFFAALAGMNGSVTQGVNANLACSFGM